MLRKEQRQYCKNKRKAQSTLEYIILVAAIIAVIILFLKPGGIFQKALNQTLKTGTDGITNMANRLSGSRPLSPD